MATARTYTVTIEIQYTATGRGVSMDLADEIKRCDRSVKSMLKERGARDVFVNVTAAESSEP